MNSEPRDGWERVVAETGVVVVVGDEAGKPESGRSGPREAKNAKGEPWNS